ncbi:hypothetical protein AXG93_2675s1290 [Marchantia polymorpha subsp. ruderalis]|uniref:Uncharacterized protein n=1 Tax=Marchantia polymorpha subsp. ruderalis TaxID=1480154 RepID=A0A176VRP7_MARPO|nr:hypothetical protein AXG93_2675s1290 [Marchantia polymorpha subsp. ruderalis]
MSFVLLDTSSEDDTYLGARSTSYTTHRVTVEFEGRQTSFGHWLSIDKTLQPILLLQFVERGESSPTPGTDGWTSGIVREGDMVQWDRGCGGVIEGLSIGHGVVVEFWCPRVRRSDEGYGPRTDINERNDL